MHEDPKKQSLLDEIRKRGPWIGPILDTYAHRIPDNSTYSELIYYYLSFHVEFCRLLEVVEIPGLGDYMAGLRKRRDELAKSTKVGVNTEEILRTVADRLANFAEIAGRSLFLNPNFDSGLINFALDSFAQVFFDAIREPWFPRRVQELDSKRKALSSDQRMITIPDQIVREIREIFVDLDDNTEQKIREEVITLLRSMA